MTDGVLTAEARLEQLIAELRSVLRKPAPDAAKVGEIAAVIDDYAEELSRWRSAHGSRCTCECEIDSHNFNCPVHGSREAMHPFDMCSCGHEREGHHPWGRCHGTRCKCTGFVLGKRFAAHGSEQEGHMSNQFPPGYHCEECGTVNPCAAHSGQGAAQSAHGSTTATHGSAPEPALTLDGEAERFRTAIRNSSPSAANRPNDRETDDTLIADLQHDLAGSAPEATVQE
jgi:hypothetical protein